MIAKGSVFHDCWQGKTPASSTALLFSHLAIWHTRLGASLRSSPYRNNKEKQPKAP